MGRPKLSTEAVVERLRLQHSDNLTLLSKTAQGSVLVEVRCNRCGATFCRRIDSLLTQDVGCKSCSVAHGWRNRKLEFLVNYTSYKKKIKESKLPIRPLEPPRVKSVRSKHECLKCRNEIMVSPERVLRAIRNHETSYGCHYCQVDNSSSSFKRKVVSIGKTLHVVQGYEDKALIGLATRYRTLVSKLDCGKPSFTCDIYRGRVSVYVPDLYDTQTRTVFEVKSTYTLFDCKDDAFGITQKKAAVVKEAGYKFKLLLVDRDGTLFRIPRRWASMSKESVESFVRKFKNTKAQW